MDAQAPNQIREGRPHDDALSESRGAAGVAPGGALRPAVPELAAGAVVTPALAAAGRELAEQLAWERERRIDAEMMLATAMGLVREHHWTGHPANTAARNQSWNTCVDCGRAKAYGDVEACRVRTLDAGYDAFLRAGR